MTGMRKWLASHRSVARVLFVAVMWVAGILLYVSLGKSRDDALFNAALWTLYMVVFWFLDARRQRKKASKLEDKGGILVYVRNPDARPGSLSRDWNMGVATFDETAGIKFQPAVYAALGPSGRPSTFRSLAAVSDEPRVIDRKVDKYVTHQGFQAIRLATDKGEIEVAGKPESLRKILDMIRQEERKD
jgi:hypothetical protein